MGYVCAVAKRGTPLLVTLLVFTLSLTGCGDTGDKNSPEAAFRRWNEAATAARSGVGSFVCSGLETDDSNSSPIVGFGSGFPAALDAELNSNVNGARAVVDFVDPGTSAVGDEEDVYVSLIKEEGSWKVCRVEITAAGGIG